MSVNRPLLLQVLCYEQWERDRTANERLWRSRLSCLAPLWITNGLCEIMHEAQNYLLKRKNPEVSFSHFAASSGAVPA